MQCGHKAAIRERITQTKEKPTTKTPYPYNNDFVAPDTKEKPDG